METRPTIFYSLYSGAVISVLFSPPVQQTTDRVGNRVYDVEARSVNVTHAERGRERENLNVVQYYGQGSIYGYEVFSGDLVSIFFLLCLPYVFRKNRSGLDVDKLDYFQRDARNSIGDRCLDVDRFIELARYTPRRVLMTNGERSITLSARLNWTMPNIVWSKGVRLTWCYLDASGFSRPKTRTGRSIVCAAIQISYGRKRSDSLGPEW